MVIEFSDLNKICRGFIIKNGAIGKAFKLFFF